MIPKNRVTTHPGTILLKEFLEPMGLTQKKLADHLDIPIQRINEIIRGKIDPINTLSLSKLFSHNRLFVSSRYCYINFGKVFKKA